MEFKIRDEEEKDIEQVREILRAAFPTDAESKLVDALRANGKAIISLVAAHDERDVWVTSCSVLSPPPHPASAKGIGLAPVAVRPDRPVAGNRLAADP